MPTLGTLFSGGGLADIGFLQAGYTPTWAIEYDARIADVYRRNLGDHMLTADVCEIDYAALPRVDHVHASPVCKNASQANVDATETDMDIATAMAVCRAIEAQQPKTFSLENVWQYRTFEAFRRICAALQANGYGFDYWHLNSADYGVPQTRRRLILMARKHGRVQRPDPTHREGGDMFHAPWVGWYEAVEDLIPTLPASGFAPWQVKRLPQEVVGSFEMCGLHGGVRLAHVPASTVVSDLGSGTVARRAFIVDGQANNHGATSTLRRDDEPMYTITASGEKRPAREFLVAQGAYGNKLVVSQGHNLTFTITANSNQSGLRAWLQHGKIVKMTPRALMRFMSGPDWYQLPESNSLACTIIGNAVPCELARHVGIALL